MVISLIQNIVKRLTIFPSKGGIFEEMRPEIIVTRASKLDFNRKIISFGGYTTIWTCTENNMNSRTVPVISLEESNDMNGQYVISLNTGKILHSKHWNQIPIDEFVIDKVKELATNEEQPVIQNKYPLFEWGVGIQIDDINIENNSDIIE